MLQKTTHKARGKEKLSSWCTNYRFCVCLCSGLTDNSCCLFEWLLQQTHSSWYPNLVIHMCPRALTAGTSIVAQVQSNKYTFLWAVSHLHDTVSEKFINGVQGHVELGSHGLLAYGSCRISPHMLQILGVFSFMCQQQFYTNQQLSDSKVCGCGMSAPA